jgi:hypothetical protein
MTNLSGVATANSSSLNPFSSSTQHFNLLLLLANSNPRCKNSGVIELVFSQSKPRPTLEIKFKSPEVILIGAIFTFFRTKWSYD